MDEDGGEARLHVEEVYRAIASGHLQHHPWREESEQGSRYQGSSPVCCHLLTPQQKTSKGRQRDSSQYLNKLKSRLNYGGDGIGFFPPLKEQGIKSFRIP